MLKKILCYKLIFVNLYNLSIFLLFFIHFIYLNFFISIIKFNFTFYIIIKLISFFSINLYIIIGILNIDYVLVPFVVLYNINFGIMFFGFIPSLYFYLLFRSLFYTSNSDFAIYITINTLVQLCNLFYYKYIMIIFEISSNLSNLYINIKTFLLLIFYLIYIY